VYSVHLRFTVTRYFSLTFSLPLALPFFWFICNIGIHNRGFEKRVLSTIINRFCEHKHARVCVCARARMHVHVYIIYMLTYFIFCIHFFVPFILLSFFLPNSLGACSPFVRYSPALAHSEFFDFWFLRDCY